MNEELLVTDTCSGRTEGWILLLPECTLATLTGLGGYKSNKITNRLLRRLRHGYLRYHWESREKEMGDH